MTNRIATVDNKPIGTDDGHGLSASSFAALGLGMIAYVRQSVIDGESAFAIHAADGSPLAVAATREIAQAIAFQNDLTLLTVH